MAFKCVIVTPEQQALDESVTQAILPAHDGLLGILTDRAPLLVKLGAGPLRIDLASGQRREFFVEGGVAQMLDNKLTVLTNEAVPGDQINAETAHAELAEATARIPTDARTAAERQRQIDRARAQRAHGPQVDHASLSSLPRIQSAAPGSRPVGPLPLPSLSAASVSFCRKGIPQSQTIPPTSIISETNPNASLKWP